MDPIESMLSRRNLGPTVLDDVLKAERVATDSESARHSTTDLVNASTADMSKSMHVNHSSTKHQKRSQKDRIKFTRHDLTQTTRDVAMELVQQSNGTKESATQNDRLADEVIIKDEIEAVSRLKVNLEKYFIAAGDKLAKSGYYDDPSVISSRLTKIWPEHARTIRDALPDKYKKMNMVREQDETPKTKIQELILIRANLFNEMGRMDMDLYHKIRKDESLEDLVASATGTETDIDRMIEEIKTLDIERESIKEKEDARQKLSTYQKIRLAMLTYMTSIQDAADTIHMSAKWAKAVQKDPDVEKAVEEHAECPACGWNISDWFNKARRLARAGKAAPAPTAQERRPEMQCRTCKESDHEQIQRLTPLIMAELKPELADPSKKV